ncbi:SigE family RNA polymerase sigma factor [Nocardioides pocheonensis]|uniref:SigE family RNA polymerase sigma factor n=2 Tax=Nocardioides pocheonensis TaxID=661485 RepID=A0A3N0GZE2_9ACTN|nr:SigE family RNA polymerase sigma factor [Nocardioides pocheonensis]
MRVDDRAARSDFESWMAAKQGRLLRTAYLLTGDVHAAEDLVQTALAKLYLAWDRVSDAPSIDAYARKILVNEHTSTWRRLWRHREVVSDTSAHDVPVRGEEYDGVSDALWSAVRSLPDRQRAVVVLRYYEQLSEKEAAEALGISVGTVKSQASRALTALRTRLGDSSWDRDDLTGWEAHR